MSSNALDTMDQKLIRKISLRVSRAVKNDEIVKARFYLKELCMEQKCKIVSEKFDGNAPLFVAAYLGHVHFVNFLLDECNADVEQTGTYEVQEDHTHHVVTPLWCAAVSNRPDVVRTLIKHKANVNALSDTQSTPVRSACYMTNIEIVKLLVENGGDIQKPNVNGGTCLINSVQSVELCKYLIDKGAKINAQDNSGNLALHYAIREGRYETVKLLLRHGSEPYIKNDLGDDALQTASLRGHQAIMEYLIDTIQPSFERQINAYELIGTNYIDEKHDLQMGIQMWKKAMEMRYRNETAPILPTLPSEPSSAYNYAVEPLSMSELEQIIHVPDSLYMQALLIKERILGSDHKDTIFGLMYRGAVYADMHHFYRCVDLWKYAYKLKHAKREPLNHESLFTLQALCKLFWEIHEEHTTGQTSESIKYDDIIDVICMTTDEITAATDKLAQDAAAAEAAAARGGVDGATASNSGSNGGAVSQKPFTMLTPGETPASRAIQQQEEYHIHLQLLLHLMALMCKLDLTDEQRLQYYRVVHTCVRVNPLGNHKKSLLHLAVEKSTSTINDEFHSYFPNATIVELLINCGADKDATDDNSNTALHLCAALLSALHTTDHETINDTRKCIEILLQKNAHVDVTNKNGQMAIAQVKRSDWLQYICIDPFAKITLKCLSARVINQHNIPYSPDDLPASLIPFIKLH